MSTSRFITVLAAALVTLAATPTLSGAGPVPCGAASAAESAPWDDADRNRIFDDLDAEMADKSPSWRRHVMVMLTEEPTPGVMRDLKASLGGFRVTSYKDHPSDEEGKPWTLIPAFAANLTKGQIQGLSCNPRVKHVEAVHPYELSMATARQETGANKAQADFVLEGDRTGAIKTYTKDDIVACIIDSGVANAHVDLNEGQVIHWKDFQATPSATPVDANGHGTHVAGILAGQGDDTWDNRGVARGTAIVAVRLGATVGDGTTTLVDGLNYCKDNRVTYGIEIVSLSAGTTGTCGSSTDTVSTAANAVVDAGLVVVVAAGNGGPGECTIKSPGAASKVITVGNVGDPRNAACSTHLGGGWYLHPTSGRGNTFDSQVKPDVVAPGTCITSTRAGGSGTTAYVEMTGTSMATPFVSGAVALMLDAAIGNFVPWTPASIKACLQDSAEHFGSGTSTTRNKDWGRGVINVYGAVDCAAGFNAAGVVSRPAHYYKGESLGYTNAVDKYTVSVSGTTWPVAITLIVPPATGKNLDLRLFNPSGVQVASSTLTTRQDTISFTPTVTGTYTIQVNAATGSGSYEMDVSLQGSNFLHTQNQ